MRPITTALVRQQRHTGTEDLVGKVALVVGGSHNQGAACAEVLAARGATTVISYAHGEHAAARTLSTLEGYGVRAEAIRSDAIQSCDVTRLFQGVIARHGQLDIVVHAVGAVVHKPLAEHTDADFDLLIDHNTRSAFNTLRAATRHLSDNGRYVVITGALVDTGTHASGMSAAAKSAVEHLVSATARELSGRDITVNSVAPGPVSDSIYSAANVPFPSSARSRLGQPEDVASVVSWLTSEAATWISGQVIRVDGGIA
ncbi:SDR family oxidoreductase [Nocardia sp. NPDC052001]|uniref:SDR family oxidoreductase n=1 Tax=Nocardia sp. NPDC052001 TaxID=3154853 RepID=UPI0034495C25